jgi:exopolysaccharide production protein ExoQ
MTELAADRRWPWSALVLGACGLLVPPASVVDPLALAPLFGIAAAATLALDARAVVAAARPLAPLALLLGLLALWAMASASWSTVPLHSFLEGLRLLAIAAGGIVLLAAARTLEPEERRLIANAAAIGLVIALVLLLVEASTDAALTRLVLRRSTVPLARFDRSATTIVLAFWAVLSLSGARRTAERWGLALATAATVFALDSAGAALAIVAGFAAFAVAWLAPRLVAAALALGLVALAIALPLALPDDGTIVALHQEEPAIKWSGIHRLLIWRFTADRIAERPVLGWGMDASRALPGGKTRFAALFPDAHLPADAEALPLHPHNAALQWQVELGLPGTLLCLAIVAWGAWRLGGADGAPHLARAGGLAWAASALVIALLDYGAWQAWWLSCLFLSAALCSAALPALNAEAAEIPAGNADSPARHPL